MWEAGNISEELVSCPATAGAKKAEGSGLQLPQVGTLLIHCVQCQSLPSPSAGAKGHGTPGAVPSLGLEGGYEGGLCGCQV